MTRDITLLISYTIAVKFSYLNLLFKIGGCTVVEYYASLRKYVGTIPLLLPGSVVIILNNKNELLLQQRLDSTWGLPGGLMELGESLEETAIREVKEETNLEISNLLLLGVFSGSEYYFKLENGDEIYSISCVYITKTYEGTLKPDREESINLEFFNISDLPDSISDEYFSYIQPYKDIIESF